MHFRVSKKKRKNRKWISHVEENERSVNRKEKGLLHGKDYIFFSSNIIIQLEKGRLSPREVRACEKLILLHDTRQNI